MNKGTLEIARKSYPSLIASEIVGVQPMTGSVGAVFSIKVKRRPWYAITWKKLVRKWYTAFGYKYVPTAEGCFGPTDYKWKRK